MSEIYLVRHGQASFGAKNYDKLSSLGHQQAVWLGEYFKARSIIFDHIVVGNMVRHKETAEGICHGLGLDHKVADFEVMPALNEFNFNDLLRAYLRSHAEFSAINNHDPKAYFRLLKKATLAWQQGKLVGPIEESWHDFQQRVKNGINLVHQNATQLNNPQANILVVSSGGVKSLILQHILEFNDEQVMPLNFQIKNTSVSNLFCTSNTLLLKSFNNLPHLDCQERFDAITYS